MDIIRVELSRELIELIEPSENGVGLLESIKMLRDDIDKSDSLSIPKVHVIDNLALPKNSFEVYIRGTKTTVGTIADKYDTAELLASLRNTMLKYKNAFSGQG